MYSFVEEEEKVEKVFEEVANNAVQIIIESTTYDKSDAYIFLELTLSDTKKIGEYIYLSEFPKKLNWKLERSELHSLHRKSLEITLFLKR